METDKAVEAVRKTREALQQIRTKLEPLLQRRRENPKDPTAKAAIALTIGTLRFMGARLRGRKPTDPLRQQLNQIRALLRKAQKYQQEQNEKGIALKKVTPSSNAAETPTTKETTKSTTDGQEQNASSASKRKVNSLIENGGTAKTSSSKKKRRNKR